MLGYPLIAPKARGLSDYYIGKSGDDVFECIEHFRCSRTSGATGSSSWDFRWAATAPGVSASSGRTTSEG